MEKIIKLALISLAAVPVLASAQLSLYIPTQLSHFDIDGVGGGGPFIGQILSGPNQTVIATETMYCDSIPQEFSLGQTFAVQMVQLDTATNTSLDPWVITQANNVASQFNSLHGGTLSDEQIVSAIQGVIWNLDGQISGTMTSSDQGTADFANYLLADARTTNDTHVSGYALFDATANYAHGNGVFGQSQIAAAPVPEPSSFLVLGLPLMGIFLRKRNRKA
jgi:hypothetical protein